MTAIYVPERFNMLNSASRRTITYCLDFPNETFNIFFGHVQTMLSIAPDKEEFLSIITGTFGFFDLKHFSPNFEGLDERSLVMLLMAYSKQEEMHNWSVLNACIFIISLVTDVSISSFNKVLFKRLRAIELMTISKPTSRDIEKWVDDKLSNPIFGYDLQSFAERVSTSNGSFFRLKDEQNEFTPFFPIISRMNRMKILMKYTDKLVPIPNSVIPAMAPVLNTATFIASMFLSLVSKNTTFNQVGLAMFVLAIRNGRKYRFWQSYDNEKTTEFDSIEKLIQELRNRLDEEDFNPFLFKMGLKGNDCQMSIIEVVQSMKKVGFEAFEKTDLPDFLRPKMDEDEDQIQKKKKERAANLKQALLKEFQNKRSQFTMGGPSSTAKGGMNSDSDDNEENNDADYDDDDDGEAMDHSHRNGKEDDVASSEIMCNICQTKVEDDILGFPCMSLPCIFPSLINSKLHNLGIELDNMECVFSMSICLHHVHRKCCSSLNKNDDGDYHCMIDRGIRNCLLPLFPDSDDLTTETSEALTEAVESFMKEAFVGQVKEGNQSLPIKSYAGAVLTIEVRHRSRPECLDNPAVPALLSNMLRTFYKALHGKISSAATEEEKDPLVKLVFMMICSNSPRNEFKEFVKQIAVSLKDDDYLYEFLRRAAIIEDFALIGQKEKESENGPKFIDWDEILSFDHLIERYEIEGRQVDDSIELPLFETIPLADRFVSLYQPPYNLDIFDISESKFVDLLTGKVVFFSKEELEIPGKPEIPHVTTYVSEKYRGGLAMFLGLTGPNASDIIISCPSIDRIFNQDGFYVDQFGDIDRGFKRGAILSLSNDRLENALDKLLSGDVILY